MKFYQTLLIICLVNIGLCALGFTQQPDIGDSQIQNPPLPAASQAQAEDISEIYDILPPEQIAADNLSFILIITAAAFCIIAIAAILIYLYKRRKKSHKINEVIYISPEEKALNALHNLSRYTDFFSQKFYFKLSLILRQYIQGRFDINAVEMTLEEILPMISKIDLNEELKRDIKNFLKISDEIKFAKMTTGRDNAANDLQLAFRFVNTTTPAKEKLKPEIT